MAMGPQRFDSEQQVPSLDVWMARRLLAGWTPQAIAASGMVHVRTAYRWRRELLGLEEVAVAGYVATFAIRRSKPPVRLSAWSSTSSTKRDTAVRL